MIVLLDQSRVVVDPCHERGPARSEIGGLTPLPNADTGCLLARSPTSASADRQVRIVALAAGAAIRALAFVALRASAVDTMR